MVLFEIFAGRVGFQLSKQPTKDELLRFDGMLYECSRQYDYLAREYPNYLYTLTSIRPQKNFEDIAETWAFAQNCIFKKADNHRPVRPAGIVEYSFDPTELVKIAHQHFSSKRDQVIKVWRYHNDEEVFGSTDTYELALVQPTAKHRVVGPFQGQDGHIAIASTWAIKMLTGENRGSSFFVDGPEFFHNGRVAQRNTPLIGEIFNTCFHEELSDLDLMDLAIADAADMSGQEIEVRLLVAEDKAGSENEIHFSPPLQVFVEPVDLAQLRKNLVVEADRDGQHRSVAYQLPVHASIDLETPLEKLMIDAPTYYSHGERRLNGIAEPLEIQKDIEPAPQLPF